MAKPQFPVEKRYGGSIVRILYDPLQFPIPEGFDAAKAGSKVRIKKPKDKDESHLEYDSFLVEYHVGAKRIRFRRNTYEKAVAKADEIGVQLLNNDTEALQITGKERRVYLAAVDNLKGIETPLDHVAKEYADATKILQPLGLSLVAAAVQLGEALKRLGNTPLLSAVEFFERHGRVVTVRKLVPEVIKELLAGLKADGAGDYHIRDMHRRLGRFGQAFPGAIVDVSTSAINEWLRGLRVISKRKPVNGDGSEAADGALLEPKTRNHYRNAVVELFNFAREQKYIARDLQTAAEATKLVKVVSKENEIFTPEEMVKLLANAPSHLIPGMAVKAFAGVRTEEIVEIEWEHILFEQACIKLPAKITKLLQRRLIHLHPNLKTWLEPHRQAEGRLCNRWTTPQSVFQAWARYAATLNIEVGENKFRNSYISYRLAETNDIGLVARESGNSPEVIQREYLEVTTPEEAAKWFAIFPPGYKQPGGKRSRSRKTS